MPGQGRLCGTRDAWWRLVLGAALLSWSLGDIGSRRLESLGGATPPTPSLADVFYLGFFPLAYVAIVLFMRGESRRLATPSWLDAAVAGLGAAAVCSAFAFHSLVKLAGGSPLAVATNLAYPIGDLLLLFLVAGASVVLSGRSKVPWLLLATGVAINVAGDTFNLFGVLGGLLARGLDRQRRRLADIDPADVDGRVDAPRPLGPACHAKADRAFCCRGRRHSTDSLCSVFASLHDASRVAVGLAAATLLLVGIRLAFSARSLRGLTQTRYEQSVTDELTGLGNRRFLFQVIDAYFAEAADAPAEHHKPRVSVRRPQPLQGAQRLIRPPGGRCDSQAAWSEAA